MNNRLKICFIVDHIATVGGVQRVVKVLATALADECDVTIFCDDVPTDIQQDIKGVSIRTFYGKNVSQTNRDLFSKIIDRVNKKTGLFNRDTLTDTLINAVYPKRVINYWIKELETFDIAIGVQGYFTFLLGVIGNRTKCKRIGWQHNSFKAYFRTPNMYSWNRDCLAKYAIRRLNSYVVLNEAYQEDIKGEFNLDVDVIYNPRSFNSSEKCGFKNKSFLAAGHLIPAKGFDRLLDSFNVFAEHESEWDLHIYGEGAEKIEILEKIKKYGLGERVFLHSYTNDIKSCFLASSVFLLPSRWEGMPMIVLESLELGVPIVSYDIQAILPIVTDGVEGYVVHDDDINGFAEKMLQCTEDYNSGALKMISQNAIKKSEIFSVPNIRNQWMQLFARIMEEN